MPLMNEVRMKELTGYLKVGLSLPPLMLRRYVMSYRMSLIARKRTNNEKVMMVMILCVRRNSIL